MENEFKKRRSNVGDRIVLTDATQAHLKRHCNEIAELTNGMVKIPLRDLANFLLQARSYPINATELLDLRQKYFDEVKALQWALSEMKQSRARGETVKLNEILKKVQMQSVGEKSTPTTATRKRKSIASTPSRPEIKELSTEPMNAAIEADFEPS